MRYWRGWSSDNVIFPAEGTQVRCFAIFFRLKIQHIKWNIYGVFSIFNLPELLEQILHFLAIDKSLYPTLFINRLWYRCGAPILWRHVELKGNDLKYEHHFQEDYN